MSKAQARIHDDIVVADTCLQGAIGQLRQGFVDIAHNIPAVVGHSGRAAELDGAPVHEAHRQAGLGHGAVHVWVGGTTGDIIDHVDAGLRSGFGNRGPHRIHGGLNPLLVQRLDDGHDAALFLLGSHAHRARAGGLAADIDHVRAGFHEVAGVVERIVDVDPAPAIGEGILRDVDDAHDQRAAGNSEIADCHCC